MRLVTKKSLKAKMARAEERGDESTLQRLATQLEILDIQEKLNRARNESLSSEVLKLEEQLSHIRDGQQRRLKMEPKAQDTEEDDVHFIVRHGEISKKSLP